MTEERLRALIDWHDMNHEDGMLWCWGPVGTVRRKVENWPPFRSAGLGDLGNDGVGRSQGIQASQGSQGGYDSDESMGDE